ncbi:MAG: glycosyltransferase family A protein [Ornithinimicrobium sp.]
MNAISHVVVAIPAHNEEDLLANCLDHVACAVAAAQAIRTGLQIEIVIALDHCTDRSADVARSRRVNTIAIHRSGVGAARDAAIRTGLRLLGDPPPHHSWLACTDADTLVPSTWLVRQFMWADRGNDLVLGTVYPDELADPITRRIWHERHHLAEGHGHVHGANLGIRADQWWGVGGFGARTRDEDIALTAAIRARTPRWVSTDSTRVLTSGRTNGRAVGGFADYLKNISGQAQ